MLGEIVDENGQICEARVAQADTTGTCVFELFILHKYISRTRGKLFL